MLKNILLSLFLAVCGVVLQAREPGNSVRKNGGMPVILDTDLGNDVDDALAMDMLYKYQDAGKIRLMAVMVNKGSEYAPMLADIMNTWYGYPRTPIGTIEGGVNIDDYVDYAENVSKLEADGKPMFRRSVKDYGKLLPAHLLYRKLLAKAEDNSVTVISVGFSTNLARLLDTPADRYSSLTGRELVAKKVRLLSVMGGDFGTKPRAEFNIVNDISAAMKVFAEWPGEIVVSPFRLGKQVCYPASSIQEDFSWGMQHPMVQCYLNYRPMPYDRPTWDLTSVLYAAEPDGGYFNVGERGFVTVSEDGHTSFSPSADGKHRILSADKAQSERILRRFIGIVTTMPAWYSDRKK